MRIPKPAAEAFHNAGDELYPDLGGLTAKANSGLLPWVAAVPAHQRGRFARSLVQGNGTAPRPHVQLPAVGEGRAAAAVQRDSGALGPAVKGSDPTVGRGRDASAADVGYRTAVKAEAVVSAHLQRQGGGGLIPDVSRHLLMHQPETAPRLVDPARTADLSRA